MVGGRNASNTVPAGAVYGLIAETPGVRLIVTLNPAGTVTYVAAGNDDANGLVRHLPTFCGMT